MSTLSRLLDKVLFWGGLVGGAAVTYQKFPSLLKNTLFTLSENESAQQWLIDSGMTDDLVTQFTAGATADEALAVARVLNEQGMAVTLNQLGEDVPYSHEAVAAKEAYVDLVGRISAENLNATISVKPSQIGIKLNRTLAQENLVAILEAANQAGVFVMLDMEDSSTTQSTIDLYAAVRAMGHANVGIMVQSALYRTDNDVTGLIDHGTTVRLVTGMYNEPSDIVLPNDAAVRENFLRLMQKLSSVESRAKGARLIVATAQNSLIQATLDWIRDAGLSKDAVEFQFLYGEREELAAHLMQEGYSVRIYVPFGADSFRYIMRRVAAQPTRLIG